MEELHLYLSTLNFEQKIESKYNIKDLPETKVVIGNANVCSWNVK